MAAQMGHGSPIQAHQAILQWARQEQSKENTKSVPRTCIKSNSQVDPQCRLCQEQAETFAHFITDCPVLRQRRIDFFQDKVITNDHKWPLRKLIEFSYTEPINHWLTKSLAG